RGFQIAAPALAVAAGIIAFVSTAGPAAGPGPGLSSRPASATPVAAGPAGRSLKLDGYQLVLPASFRLVSPKPACLHDLNLNAGEQQRLFSTPDASCPLLIAAVQASLPASAYEVDITIHPTSGGPRTIKFYRVFDAKNQTLSSYLPAKLPDGRTVYVILDPRLSAPADEQLLQLQQGLRVSS
ncbi:MAG: hypothetical protein ABI140_19125, partial [Jatrophihabitantaceae bacterium]